MSLTDAALFVPPMPSLASPNISGLRMLLQLGRNALAAFPARCFDEPVIRLPLPGSALVLANAPEAVRSVLQENTETYARLRAGKRILRPIVGRGLLVSEGAAWRRQRRAMAPAFTPRTVPVLAGHIMNCAEAALRPLETQRATNLDLLDTMQRLALHIASASMFAVETETFGDDLRHMVTGYMTTIGRPAASDFLLPSAVPTLLGLRRTLFRHRWRRLVRTIIATRRARSGPSLTTDHPRDLFDLMAAAHGERDEDLLVDEVATMIVAGHETTALVLFWSCYLLAHAPEWQQAIADEVHGLDLSPERAAAAIPALPQTRAVVQEALRLYPPAFMTARQACRADTLCGVPIPNGAIVLVPFWLMHRNRRWWGPTADAFDPSRFLSGSDPLRFTYLPFGAGPHVCIGAQLALTEAILVLARLLRGSKIALAGDRDVLPVGVLSTRPDHAALFRLDRR